MAFSLSGLYVANMEDLLDATQLAISSTGTGTVSVTISAATAGNLLVGMAACNETVADQDINTPAGWSTTSLNDINATAKVRGRMFFKVAAGGETSAAFAAASGTPDMSAWIIEWSGISNAVEDVAAEATGSTSPALTGTVGSPAVGAAGFALIAINNNNNLTAPTNSYTLEGTVVSSNASAPAQVRLALLYNASPGATNTQLTQSGTARSYVGQLVTFKAGATNATATPSTVATTSGVGSPTVKTGETVTPSTVVTTSAVATPQAQGGAQATPAAVVTTSAVPSPSVKTGETATPATVGTTTSVPTPSVSTTVEVVPAVRLFGKTGTFYNLNGDTVLNTEQTFDQVTVAGWATRAGKSLGWSALADGKLFMSGQDMSGAPTLPTGTEMVFSIFDPVTPSLTNVVVPTSNGTTSVLGSNGVTGGAVLNDVEAVVVGAETYVCFVSTVPYNGWQISVKGTYPTLCVARKIAGTWQYDVSKSYTADQLHASSADGALAFPNQVNSFSETYAVPQGLAEIITLPGTTIVVGTQYFNDYRSTKAGSLVAIDVSNGVVKDYWEHPYTGTGDPQVTDMGMRAIIVDPTATGPVKRFAVIFDCYRSGASSGFDVVQEFTYDTATDIIAAASIPVKTDIANRKWGNGVFDSDGNLWLAEEGSNFLAGDTCVFLNPRKTLSTYAPIGSWWTVPFQSASPDVRITPPTGTQIPWGRLLEDTTTKTVFWQSLNAKVVAIARLGTGSATMFIPLPKIDLDYKNQIESQEAAGVRGKLLPSDSSIDVANRFVWVPLAQLDSSTTAPSYPTAPHVLDNWIYRLDLDRLFQRPVFGGSAASSHLVATDIVPTLPSWLPGDTVLVFVTLTGGGETRTFNPVEGWVKEVDAARIAGSFGPRWAVFSRVMGGNPALDIAPDITWAGGAINANCVSSAWTGGAPRIVIATGNQVANGTTITRPAVTPYVGAARQVGFYGSDGHPTYSGLAGEILRRSDNAGGIGPSTYLTDEELTAVSSSRTATLSGTQQNVGVTLALAPATVLVAPQVGAGIALAASDVGAHAHHHRRRHGDNFEHIEWSIDGKHYPVLEDWQAQDVAPGGYADATLHIPYRFRRRFSQGDIVIGHRANGDILYWGELDTDPKVVPDSGDGGGKSSPVLELKAVGPQSWIRNQDGRLPFQTRDYGLWVPSDSEPHKYSPSAKYTTDVRTARLMLSVDNVAYVAGNQASAVLWVPGWEIQSVTATLKKSADDANFEFQWLSANGPSGSLTAEGGAILLGAGNPDGTALSQTLSGPSTAASPRDLLMLRINCNTNTTPANRERFWLIDLCVDVIVPATTTEMSPMQILADVFARTGYRVDVAASGKNALPLDWTSGAWDQLADFACVFDDFRWLVREPARAGLPPRGTAGPWGDGDDIWQFRAGWRNEDLDPEPLYNVVVVRWITNSGVVREETVRANPDPLKGRRDRVKLIDISGTSPKPDNGIANAIADASIRFVSTPRLTGTLNITKARRSRLDPSRSPYRVRAGGLGVLLDRPDMPPQRIAAVTYEAKSRVTVNIASRSEDASAMRLLALAADRQARAH